MECGEITCCTWLTPNPLFPHFPPSHLFLPICWGVNRSVNICLSIDALLQGHKHEQNLLLCSPAHFLEHRSGQHSGGWNQQPALGYIPAHLSSTDWRERRWAHGRGEKRGVEDAASPLWISSGKWAVELQYISWLSKSINMCSAFNKIIPPHFTKSWISSLRLSIPGFFLFPKLHFGIVKRSSLILILVYAPGHWKLLEFIVLL